MKRITFIEVALRVGWLHIGPCVRTAESKRNDVVNGRGAIIWQPVAFVDLSTTDSAHPFELFI